MKFTSSQQQTLLEALSGFMKETSRGKLRKMLTEGRIQVNETIQHKAKFQVEVGMQIEILSRIKAQEITPPPTPKHKRINLNVIWEDEAILVVEKPAGLLSIATDKLEVDTLHSRCVDYVRLEDERNPNSIPGEEATIYKHARHSQVSKLLVKQCLH